MTTRHSNQDIYNFIVKYKAANDGNSPTFREIATGLGLASVSDVPRYLASLEAEGLIKRPEVGKSRGIIIVGGRWFGPGEQIFRLGTTRIRPEFPVNYEELSQ